MSLHNTPFKKQVKYYLIGVLSLVLFYFLGMSIQKTNQTDKSIASQVASMNSTKQLDFVVVSESIVGLKDEKRGTLKVRISNSYMPTKSEIRSLARKAFTDNLQTRYKDEFTVFIYAEGMNINQSAFAWVEFINGRLSSEFMGKYAEDYFIK